MDFRVKICRISIICDNISAVNIAKNPMHHKSSKHIDVCNHFLHENIEKGHIEMTFCKTKNQVGDIFTKVLGREHFDLNRLHLGLIRGI